MDPLDELRRESWRHDHGLRLGRGRGGAVAFAAPEHSVLAIGPPRSGKTSAVVVPNVVSACGPVLATSTKPDLMLTTSLARARVGRCMLFDPSGLTEPAPNVERIAWSPLRSCADWQQALLVTESMVRAARSGPRSLEATHWTERAHALIAPCFHAAALAEMPMADVMSFIDRREGTRFRAVLAARDTTIPLDTLNGLLRTDERELSGIWSTASSILSAYRSPAALEAAEGRQLDVESFVRSGDTLYICAPSESQAHAAPIVAGLLRDVRSAAYGAAARGELGHAAERAPLVLALDELANIAPLHDLPALVSEGGSQGVVTLACIQDLSQVSERWGRLGEGFLSLFNAKLVFPGIGDTRTLEAISLVGGDHQVQAVSTTEGDRRRGLPGLVGRRQPSRRTVSERTERRLPPDLVGRGVEGHAVLVEGAAPSFVEARRWFADPAVSDAVHGMVGRHLERDRPRRRGIGREL